ncbi:NUDIX domain-containing protein [Candidatus Uhrbacteria bacterium]|nr:NUDIX domain-containing protein [Candidatus Uhrbacteria bacterium]
MNSSPIVIGRPFYAGGFFYNAKTGCVLLHKRDGNTTFNPNKWGFFGGKSEENESAEQCFMREIQEELSVSLREQELRHLCSYLNPKYNIDRHVFFVENALQKSEMILREGEDFDWIPLDRVETLDLTDSTKRDLNTFKQMLQDTSR